MTESNRLAAFLKLFFASLAIFGIAMWTYHGTTGNEFVPDSVYFIRQHVFYLTYASLSNTVWMFVPTDAAVWHPLVWLSWAIDYSLYSSLAPSGFHFNSNIFHAVNSTLVLIVALVTFGLNRPSTDGYPISFSNNALVAASLAALIWAVHPQHVEAVAWVSSRKELLCLMFLLLSLLTYVKYSTCAGKVKTFWYYISLVLFMFAALSNPVAVTYPLILILFDVYPLRRTRVITSCHSKIKTEPLTSLLFEKVPFFLLSVLLITLFSRYSQTATTPNSNWYLAIFEAFSNLTFYVQGLLIPTDLSASEPIAGIWNAATIGKVFFQAILFLGISLACIVAFVKKRPYWLISWLFFLVTLAPTIGLVSVLSTGPEERFAYVPTLAFYLLFAGGILYLLNRLSIINRLFLATAIVVIAAGLVHNTQNEIPKWKDLSTYWTHMVESQPDNSNARFNLGMLHLNKGETTEAIPLLSQSIALSQNPTVMAYRGMAYLLEGEFQSALLDYKYLIDTMGVEPDAPVDKNCLYFNLGWLYANTNSITNAAQLFGRVEPTSQLGTDAATWLSYLNDQGGSRISPIKFDELPLYCQWVFESRTLIEGKRQDAKGD